MTEKFDIKKSLEAALGRKITEEELNLIPIVFPVATFTLQNVTLTYKNIFPSFPNTCTSVKALDVFGHSATGNTGRVTFLLSQFTCIKQFAYEPPVNVVATPQSDGPCYLTVLYHLVGGNTDVEITVFSWDFKGQPAPNIQFDWRCRALALEG